MIERIRQEKVNFVRRLRNSAADAILRLIERYEEGISHPPMTGEEAMLSDFERLAEEIRTDWPKQ